MHGGTSLSDVSDDAITSHIRNYVHNAPYDCLFHDTVQRRLSSFLAMRPSLMESALRRLEAHEEREAEFECEESARLNLHTFIHWCMKKRPDELMEQNERTLGKYQCNIAALTFKMKFLLENEHQAAESKLVLDEIVKLINSSNDQANINVFVCEAEIARAYHFLGQQFYCEALDRYEKVTKMSGRMPDDDSETAELIDCCHFRLAQTFNRMMSPTYRPVLKLKGISALEAFERISDQLTAVIDGNKSKFVARSMIELVEAYERCKKADKIIMEHKEFPYLIDVNKFVEDALDKGRDEPYVLEHCGKYYRHHAEWNDDRALKHAIDILDRCTDSSNIKHVAWHQKGLLYMSLSNSAKFGNKGAAANGKDRSRGSRWQHGASHEDRQNKYTSKEYMQNALYCFKQACDITRLSRCSYLTDYAKCLAQLGRTEEAKETYEKADSLTVKADHVDDGDLYYLYSRWAVFTRKQLDYQNQGRFHESGGDSYSMEDLMTMCRKAVRFALVVSIEQQHSRISYDLLFQCLREKVHFESDNYAVELEFAIITKVIEAFSKHGMTLIELLKSDDQLLAAIYQLLQTLKDGSTRSYNDANTVYLYLTAMAKARKLDLTSQEYYHVSLDVAKTMNDNSKHQGSFNRVLRDVFRWYIRDVPDGALASEENSDVRLEDDFDTYVVTCTEEDTEETCFVMDLLQEHLGLFVGRLTPSILTLDDQNSRSLIRFTSAILIDQRSHNDWTFMENELKRLDGNSTATICVVSCDETGNRSLDRRLGTNQWPTVVIDQSKTIDESAISLVRSMITSMVSSRSRADEPIGRRS